MVAEQASFLLHALFSFSQKRLDCSGHPFLICERVKLLSRVESQITPPHAASDDVSSGFRKGVVFALLAQTMWGVFPIYLKLLSPTPALDVVAHRAIWAFLILILLTFVGSLIRLRGWPRWAELAESFGQPKMLWLLLAAAILIALNWLGFVAAVEQGRAMDVSVGYYICPQIVVILGVLFQKERLAMTQWIAFGVTSLGVVVMAASKTGVPWFGLVVAFSFGFYALVKKQIQCSAMTSLTFETGILFLPAVALLLYRGCWYSTGVAPEATASWISPLGLQLLLVSAGIATLLPLALYVSAVRCLPLSVVGVLQFLGPTIQFGLSVFWFGEPLDPPRLLGIVLVWIGVGFFLRGARRTRPLIDDQ